MTHIHSDQDEDIPQRAIVLAQHKVAGRFHILVGEVAQVSKEIDLILAASTVGARAEVINLIAVVPPIDSSSTVSWV